MVVDDAHGQNRTGFKSGFFVHVLIETGVGIGVMNNQNVIAMDHRPRDPGAGGDADFFRASAFRHQGPQFIGNAVI